MVCEKCGNRATYGAPHDETIKLQRECASCGNIECEFYTPEEMTVIALTEAGHHYLDARRAVAEAFGNITEAKKILDSRPCRI